MARIYINGISSISPQPEDIFETGGIEHFSTTIIPALDQDYKSFIKPMTLRRMSKAVKMGLFCAKKALLDAQTEMPDVIIVGTGQGCLQDTGEFMESMLSSNEGLLSPTSFIQSTHNTVAGQIALNLKCTGYNMTYTQNSASFESALLDASLQFQENTNLNVLVGGVDEISDVFTGFQQLDGQIKQEAVTNMELFGSGTPGTILSEASGFFVLGSEKKNSSYAELKDVRSLNRLNKENITDEIHQFLKSNHVKTSEIDIVILGNNGDIRYDHLYHHLQDTIFSNSLQLGYKHLVGQNDSVSAYAMWLGSKILKEQRIPDIFKMNDVTCNDARNILIYNQYLGKNHGLILLQKP